MRALLGLALLALTLLLSQQNPTSTRTPASESSRDPSSGYTCRIATGYGTAIGHGSSKLKAKENAREICGSQIIDQYFAQRGRIDPDAELELACVNLECI